MPNEENLSDNEENGELDLVHGQEIGPNGNNNQVNIDQQIANLELVIQNLTQEVDYWEGEFNQVVTDKEILKKEIDEEIETLNLNHAQEIVNLRTQHDEEEREIINKIKSSHAEEIKKIESKHAEEIEKIEFKYAHEITKLKLEFTATQAAERADCIAAERKKDEIIYDFLQIQSKGRKRKHSTG